MSSDLQQHTDENSRNVAVGCHLLAFLGLVFPFGNIIGPLLLWIFKRYQDQLINEHGREAVNFQISFSLWMVIAGAVAAITAWTLILPVLIGIGMLVLFIVWIVSVITAASRASRGEDYRYPLTWRLFN